MARGPPPMDRLRARQVKFVAELGPIVSELDKTSLEAMRAWKQFTKAMEDVAHLYGRYAALLPTEANAGELGLHASAAPPRGTTQMCKKYKAIVERWSLSDAVVDMRAQLFKDRMVWRGTEERVQWLENTVEERKQQREMVRTLRDEVQALKKSKAYKSKDPDAVTASQMKEADMLEIQREVFRNDRDIRDGLASMLKKSLPHGCLGAAATALALHNVGRGLVKAFDGFSVDEGDEDALPDIAQTPTLGVPVLMDWRVNARLQIATPASIEAEYGLGAAYNSRENSPSATFFEDTDDPTTP